MAGILRPNNNVVEGTWTVNNAVAGYGTGITNLFDGIRGIWNNGNTFYWNAAGTYIDITLHQDSAIWILPNVGYLNYNKGLAVYKYNDESSTFELLRITDDRTTNDEWQLMITLPEGRYRFSHNANYRMDDEWFIESLVINKVILRSNNKLYNLESSMYSDVLNRGGIALASHGQASAANAFNGNDTANYNTWWTTPASSLPSWLQYELPEPTQVDIFRIKSYYTSGFEAIKDFTISGSNTGEFNGEQVLLFTGVHPNETTSDFLDYSFVNNKSFKFYRIDISTLHPGNGSNNSSIAQVEMRTFIKEVTEFQKLTVDNFIKLGMNKSEIKFNSIFNRKNYIIEDKDGSNPSKKINVKLNKKPNSIRFN